MLGRAEYKVISIESDGLAQSVLSPSYPILPPEKLEAKLNSLAKEGWRLIQVVERCIILEKIIESDLLI